MKARRPYLRQGLNVLKARVKLARFGAIDLTLMPRHIEHQYCLINFCLYFFKFLRKKSAEALNITSI